MEGYSIRNSHCRLGHQCDHKNMGLGLGDVYITVDGSEKKATGHMRNGSSSTFYVTQFGEIPLTWRVELMSDGADECVFEYKIWN